MTRYNQDILYSLTLEASMEKMAGSALRSRLLVKIKKNIRSGGWEYNSYIKTGKDKTGEDKLRHVGVIEVNPHGMVEWVKVKEEFQGMGMGKRIYSQMLQHQHKLHPKKKFPAYGDSLQSGFAHQAWSNLRRGPKTSGPKKVKGAKQDVREVRTGQIPLKPGERIGIRLTKGTLPVVLHRPGSKRAKEQAKRFIAQGRPQSEWTTTEQIKRWKRAKDMKADERGLAPPRYVGKSPARKAPHIEVKARDKKTKEFAEAQRKGEMMRGLGDSYAWDTAEAKKIQRLQKALPKDSPFLFGTSVDKERVGVHKLTTPQKYKLKDIGAKRWTGEDLTSDEKALLSEIKQKAQSAADKRGKGKRLYDVDQGSWTGQITAGVYSPAYQGRILNKKMREADHSKPSRKYGRKQKPHGKRKAKRPARDHTKGFDLKDRSTWYTPER